MKKEMGKKQFVKEHAQRCPFCRSHEYQSDFRFHINTANNEILRDCYCHDCNKSFQLVYKLKGYVKNF